MFAQRATQQALRRIAQPSLMSQLAARNVAAPLALTSQIQTRPVATQKLTPADSQQILIEQRRHRPTSPHLSIYRPQMTWIASSLNRITGAVLSGGFYIFGAGYLLAPLVGLNFGSASMVAAFGAWPVAAKVATKLLVAFPFTFHSFAGLRHLAWDAGKHFNNQGIIRSGWALFIASGATSLYLATMV